MHGEWPTGPNLVEAGADPPRDGSDTSWNGRRLVASAAVVTIALFVMGIGVAHLFSPRLAAGEDVPATEVAGAIEEAPAAELGDAVASVREGPFVPAPVEHLVVVHVSVSVCGARSTGSGVVIADGILLTAAHVVGDASLVRIDQGGITVTGEVLGVLADERDLALVAVDAPMEAPLAAGVVAPVGAPLTLVGYPDGGPRTISVGGRVAVDEVVAGLAGGGEILGVDVAITAGISGGPAVDERGDVVGIVVAKELAGDTALVVATPDLSTMAGAALVPGSCAGSA